MSSILAPDQQSSISVGLVDLDETTESELLTMLFVETVSEEGFMKIEAMDEQAAEQKLENNELSAYFMIPEGLTDDLYKGVSVVIPIIGNSTKPTDSFIVKELMDSMTRLLSTAQANILTIFDFSKEIDMPQSEREDLLIEQFVDFTFFTLGKDKVLMEEEITNIATNNPVYYYTVSFLFILMTIWVFGFMTLLSDDEQEGMRVRYTLYGVTLLQQAIAKMIIAGIGTLFFLSIAYFVIQSFLSFELYFVDYMRIMLFALLYILQLSCLLILCHIWIRARRLSLLSQLLVVIIVILLSGALIPKLYFPEILQATSEYLFSEDAFSWFIDLMVEGRNYANYTFLGLSAFFIVSTVFITSFVKERWVQ